MLEEGMSYILYLKNNMLLLGDKSLDAIRIQSKSRGQSIGIGYRKIAPIFKKLYLDNDTDTDDKTSI
jgi:hypothetical protein